MLFFFEHITWSKAALVVSTVVVATKDNRIVFLSGRTVREGSIAEKRPLASLFFFYVVPQSEAQEMSLQATNSQITYSVYVLYLIHCWRIHKFSSYIQWYTQYYKFVLVFEKHENLWIY